MGEFDLNVNGTRLHVSAPDEETLLSVLRNRLDLIGTKYGCGEGQCGACTVLLDGRAVPCRLRTGLRRSRILFRLDRVCSAAPRAASLHREHSREGACR